MVSQLVKHERIETTVAKVLRVCVPLQALFIIKATELLQPSI